MPLLANRDRQGKAEGKRGYGLLCTTSLLHDALRGKRSRGKSSTPSSSESRLDDISRFQVRNCVLLFGHTPITRDEPSHCEVHVG